MAPGLVPSPRHPGGCLFLLVFLTGSERRGNFIHGARPRAIARHPGGCDDMLLSLSDPRAQRGENGVTRQTTSSTTHSLTGPSPCASMATIPLMRFCACFIYVFLPLRVNTLHICFCLEFFGPRANGGQQSYYTHMYSSSGPYGGQILVLVFFICLLIMMSTLTPVGAL